MKLIEEYIVKIVLLVIASIIVIEGFIIFLLVTRAKIIFKSIYNETIEKTETKSIEITKKIEEYATNLLTRYMTDLKLICKHAQLLNGKGNENSLDDMINNSSEILSKNNKEILIATSEELSKIDYLNNIVLNQTYDYISSYEKEFKDISDQNYILNKLFSDKHKELDSVGYYNNGNKNSLPNDKEENISLKYIVSILKSIFIRRYLIKRQNMDYIRFFIIYQNNIYIYPPEAYNKTNIYFFEYSYPTGNCNFTSSNSNQQFPLCVYNYMNDVSINYNDNNLVIIKEKINLQKNFAALCLKIHFKKRQSNYNIPFVCSELEFSSLFNSANFELPKKFDYGIFTFSDEKIVPLVFGRKDLYNEIISLYNNTNNTRYRIEKIKNSETFSLFHFLYYNLTKTLINHTELKLDYNEIDSEYNIILNRIDSEVKTYLNNKKNNNGTDRIIFKFNKTMCQKGLLNNNYGFVKDEFEMIIFPLTFEIHKLDENYIEKKEDVLEETFDLYIFSIIAINPNINEQKMLKIINIKIKRVLLLFTFLTTSKLKYEFL